MGRALAVQESAVLASVKASALSAGGVGLVESYCCLLQFLFCDRGPPTLERFD